MSFSEVLDGALFLGPSTIFGDELRERGIKRVLNMTEAESVMDLQDIEEKRVSIDDTEDTDILSVLDTCIEYVASSLDEKVPVYVHCSKGVSRSATVVLAYLVKKRNMSLRDAFAFLVEKRDTVRPNVGFFRQLGELDKQVHGKESYPWKEYAVLLVKDFFPDATDEQIAKALADSEYNTSKAIKVLMKSMF